MKHFNAVEESSPHEREAKEPARLEIMQTPHLQETLSCMQDFAARINQDQAVTEGQMTKFEHLLSSLSLDRGDRQGVPFTELLKLKELKDTIQILHKIKRDGVGNMHISERNRLASKLAFIDDGTVFKLTRAFDKEDIPYTNLSGLTALDARVAQALHYHKGDIRLDGITSIEPQVLKILFNRNRKNLFMYGLTHISPELVRVFIEGRTAVWLDGVIDIDISVEAAREFASQSHKYHGKVYFRKELLATLGDEVRQILASIPKHERFFYFGGET